MKYALFLAAALAFNFAALGLSRGDDATPAPTPVVTIDNYAYSPDQLTVSAGQSVRFVNHDDAAHTITDKGGAFDSGSINKDKTWTYKFDKAGTYSYYCAIHPSMRATITVQ
jgi:plastocyanin